MKFLKLLIVMAFSAFSLNSNAQAVTLTQPNPATQLQNQWPSGNSWNMVQPVYNDMVTLNAATNNAATAAFTTISPYVASTGLSFTGQRETVISDSSLTSVTITAAQSGATILLKALAGDTIVLPTATTANLGVHYTVILAYATTSVGHTIKTAGTDVFRGVAFVHSTTTPFTNPFTSTANKTMTMTPTTTGGLAGGRVELVCIGTGRWSVTATLHATGTVATPFLN